MVPNAVLLFPTQSIFEISLKHKESIDVLPAAIITKDLTREHWFEKNDLKAWRVAMALSPLKENSKTLPLNIKVCNSSIPPKRKESSSSTKH